MSSSRVEAARGMLWIGLLVLSGLVWFGPASWLRGDASRADAAERAADDAEAAALTPPAVDEPTAAAVIAEFGALSLVRWSDDAVFWEGLLPDPPPGLRLRRVGSGGPEATAAAGVSKIGVAFEIEVPVPAGAQIDPANPPAAPGGLAGTWEWIAGLNQRPDMQLLGAEISSTGAAVVSLDVWVLDPLPQPDDMSEDTADE